MSDKYIEPLRAAVSHRSELAAAAPTSSTAPALGPGSGGQP